MILNTSSAPGVSNIHMLDNLISLFAASGIKAPIASPRIVDCFGIGFSIPRVHFYIFRNQVENMGFHPSSTPVTQSLRAASRRHFPSLYLCPSCSIRYFRSSRRSNSCAGPDPRLEAFGKVIRDEYAVVRDYYGSSRKL